MVGGFGSPAGSGNQVEGFGCVQLGYANSGGSAQKLIKKYIPAGKRIDSLEIQNLFKKLI